MSDPLVIPAVSERRWQKEYEAQMEENATARSCVRLKMSESLNLLPPGSVLEIKWGTSVMDQESPSLPIQTASQIRIKLASIRASLRPDVGLSVKWGKLAVPMPSPEPAIPPKYPDPIYCYPCMGQEMIA